MIVIQLVNDLPQFVGPSPGLRAHRLPVSIRAISPFQGSSSISRVDPGRCPGLSHVALSGPCIGSPRFRAAPPRSDWICRSPSSARVKLWALDPRTLTRWEKVTHSHMPDTPPRTKPGRAEVLCPFSWGLRGSGRHFTTTTKKPLCPWCLCGSHSAAPRLAAKCLYSP